MLITNATLVTWGQPNQVLPGWGLLIENGKIVEIGPESELKRKYPYSPELDAQGQLVMPGNICAHTHFYGAYSRGMAIPGNAPENFAQILDKLWWPLDKHTSKWDQRQSPF
jgi:cytosine/adenosine deaminase-related metal-dependent hydrolase